MSPSPGYPGHGGSDGVSGVADGEAAAEGPRTARVTSPVVSSVAKSVTGSPSMATENAPLSGEPWTSTAAVLAATMGSASCLHSSAPSRYQ